MFKESKKIEMKEVESSYIQAIGYDTEMQLLVVLFSSGAIYRYHKVPADVFESFLAAESAGKYFHRVVRHGFQTVQVPGELESDYMKDCTHPGVAVIKEVFPQERIKQVCLRCGFALVEDA